MKEKIAYILIITALLGVSVDSRVFSFAFKTFGAVLEDIPAMQEAATQPKVE